MFAMVISVISRFASLVLKAMCGVTMTFFMSISAWSATSVSQSVASTVPEASSVASSRRLCSPSSTSSPAPARCPVGLG